MSRANKNILDILKLKPDRSRHIYRWGVSQPTVIVLIPAPGPDTALLCQTEAMLGPGQGLANSFQDCPAPSALTVVITAPDRDSSVTRPHYVGPATVDLVTGLEIFYNDWEDHTAGIGTLTNTTSSITQLKVFVVTNTKHPAVSLHQREILPAIHICCSSDA